MKNTRKAKKNEIKRVLSQGIFRLSAPTRLLAESRQPSECNSTCTGSVIRQIEEKVSH
jgi:hypothetical protein